MNVIMSYPIRNYFKIWDKLFQDELTKAENELKILRERKNQQLNEFNSKLNNSTNYIPSSVTPQQVTEPQIKKYYKDLLRMRAILAKQQITLNKFLCGMI
ncbi:hypothetical protein Mgra_00007851 [Meloidogyne graminicola]|uniref:Uncharacterized protein n=1 Tax=Meloidogyne graminicola TaxID=189291 RepID=A0A8S9ZHV3_9BILA|nr:hypothetical protein Mgra_00007851 [Meloidogyne graminicola]